MRDMQIVSSNRQVVIYDTFRETDYNLLVQAVAGSGKTTTLIGILALAQYRTLFLAFNKSIQEEISTRIEQAGFQHAKAMTLHSLGLMALNFHFGKVIIDKNKNYKLIKSLQEYNKGLFARMSWEEKSKTTITLMEMNDVSRIYLTNEIDVITAHMEEMDKFFFLHPLLDELWTEFLYIRTSFEEQKIIDFIDMIYMVVDRQLAIPLQPYYLMIDECQDLSVMQHKFVNQFIEQGDIHKWIAVGDRRQCQPLGTKVLMKDLSEKNIEDLVIGDEVISYHIRKCQFVGNGKSYNARAMKVLQTNISTRFDSIFTFTLANEYKSSYTSNHKCYVQLSEDRMSGKYVVYMMRKGSNFRIGISPCSTVSKAFTFGPITRALSEQADDLWILKIFNSRGEAYLHEQILSYKFKIPQLRFRDKSSSDKGMSQNDLDTFWHEFKNQHLNASEVLKWFYRDIKYPFWSNTNKNQGGIGNSWKVSSSSMFKTQACNIIPEIMDMCIFDSTNIGRKGGINRKMIPITNWEVNLDTQQFVSLDIEDNHNYVADGILTANSIYGFSGSHSSSFDLFKERPNVIELPLDVCYRCPQLVIQEANLVYDVMQGYKTEPGVVTTITDFGEVKEGSMIICRNSAPLINAYFELLSRDKKVYLKGEDILNELNRFLKPYQYKKIRQVLDELRTEINSLEEKTNLTDKERFKIYKLNDNLKNLTLLASNFCKPTDKVEEVLTRLQYMFDTISDNDAIILCTIHKSKGLEADIVYILNEFLIPSKFAKSKSQLEQEKNLKYVARTRAKKELHYLNIGKKPNKEE